MKMRLKPQRGHSYDTTIYGKITFLEKAETPGLCKVIRNGQITTITMDTLKLPYIETHHYDRLT